MYILKIYLYFIQIQIFYYTILYFHVNKLTLSIPLKKLTHLVHDTLHPNVFTHLIIN